MRDKLKNHQKIISIVLVVALIVMYMISTYSPYVERINEGNKAEQILEAAKAESASASGVEGQVRAAAGKIIELAMAEVVDAAAEKLSENPDSYEALAKAYEKVKEELPGDSEADDAGKTEIEETEDLQADAKSDTEDIKELPAAAKTEVEQNESLSPGDVTSEISTAEGSGDTLDTSAEKEIQDVKAPDKQTADSSSKEVIIKYKFRNNGLWEEHFEKHGGEFPYATKEEYLEGANIMLDNPDKLHKHEKEDGDDVYYLEETNEFIIVSRDGYLRTYFKPSKGKKYFDRQ